MSIHAGKRWIWSSNCADFAGNEPPFGKILAYDSRIEGIYVNGTGAFPLGQAEDKFVTPALMTRIRSFGLLAGCWFVPRTTNAMVEASRAANMVTWLNPDCVMLDVESHDLAFQRAFVAEYRRLKPGRATDWTMEPRQEAAWKDAQGVEHGSVALKEILAARMDVFPQLYKNDMRPADAKHECLVWGAGAGFERFHLFLNAAQDWWNLDDGALFTAETLPDKRKALVRLPIATKARHTQLAESLPTLEPCGEEPYEEAAA